MADKRIERSATSGLQRKTKASRTRHRRRFAKGQPLLQPVSFMAARTATEALANRLNLGDNFAMARRRAKFYEVLRQQQEKEKLVCVYHGDDGHDKFDVGFIESLTPTTLTLLSV